MRSVGHQRPDGPEVARGGQPTGDHDQDLGADALDLLEDVRREEDRSSGRGHLAEQIHHRQALAWIHAVERLVEQQHLRVVDERSGDLDPLAHALGVGADRRGPAASSRPTRLDRRSRGRVAVGQALQPGVEADVLEAGQERVDGLAFRHQPDLAVDRRIACGLRPRTRTVPADGARKPASMWSRVVLPAPLGPSRPVTPATEG